MSNIPPVLCLVVRLYTVLVTGPEVDNKLVK